ncbi:hypothetical protein V6C32_10950 [Desulforamulus ruminis]|uniref:hypothetical protein n=1 Tax=Desulforamulus ruminis TaxID=1564 RepID=UPI002FDB8CF3
MPLTMGKKVNGKVCYWEYFKAVNCPKCDGNASWWIGLTDETFDMIKCDQCGEIPVLPIPPNPDEIN